MAEKERKIKVVIKLIENEVDDESELEKVRKNELIQKTKDYFYDYFDNEVCPNCKENTKGIVYVELYGNGSSAILGYPDFCCFEFMEKIRKIPK